MNHISTLTRSRWLLLTLFTLLVGVSPAWGDELTIYESATSTTSYEIPIYAYNCDGNGNQSEFVVPSSMLTSMAGKNITAISFYCANFSWATNIPRYKVYMKEVASATLSSYAGDTDATTVYTGELSVTAGVMTITFSTPYEYAGGHLLVGTKVVQTGSWVNKNNSTFYGSTDSDVTCSRSSDGNKYFIPKTTFTYESATVEGPGFVVKDGSTKLSSPYAYSFGLTAAGTTKTFKLTNPGNAATPIALSSTGNVGASIGEATSIAAGGEVTLTLTMPDADASGTVTITPTGAGLSPFVFNVSGTKFDPNKVYETLLTGSIPDDWTTSGGTWNWSTTNGASNTAWNESSNYRLITPKLTIAEGEKFFFDAQGTYSGYQGVIFEYSSDGTTWTASSTTTTVNSEWQTFQINDIPAGKYYIAIHGWHVNVRNFYGGELPNEPKMVIMQPTTLGFGLYDKDASPAPTKTFTIANTGKAVLNGISVTSGNAAFTITGAPASLAAGKDAEVTITMSTATAGALSSLITVSATDMEDASFIVTGTVKPAGMPVEDFSGTTIPDGWSSTGSWSFTTDGVAIGTSGTAYLYTPKLKLSAGDFIIIKAKNTDGDASDYITVAGSVNEGTDNYTAYSKKITVANNSDYATFIVTDIPTTINKIRFTGGWVNVDEIHGLNYAPVLAVTKDETPVSSPAAYDFGEQAANASVTYNFANAGAGTLSVTNVEVTNTPNDGTYTTNWTESVATPFNLVITQNYDAEKAGAKTGSVVVTMSDASTFTINLSGTLLAANAPTLAVDNTLEFGKLTANDTQTVTVTNSGTGSMTVNIESDNALFTVSPAQLTEIGAGASKTFDVTFHYDQVTAGNYGVKNANITVTPTYNAEAAIVINASAKAKDPEEWGEDFAGNVKPDGWEVVGSGWTFTDGVARGTYVSNSYLYTPSLSVEAGQSLSFKAKARSYNTDIKVYYSKDGGDYISCISQNRNSQDEYETYEIENLETGNYVLRFTADNYDLDNIEGFKLNADAPAFGYYTNSECTAAAAATVTRNYGFVTEAPDAVVYYMKNDGTGTLNLTLGDVPTGFTAVLGKTSLAAGESTTLTINMPIAIKGYRGGDIVVTGKDSGDNTLGTFTVTASGVVIDEDKLYLDFTQNSTELPAAWTNKWEKNNAGYPRAGYSKETMETTKLVAEANEKIVIVAKNESNGYVFGLNYKAVGDENWTELIAEQNIGTDWNMLTATIPAAGNYLLQFVGSAAQIQRIYGLATPLEPVMVVYDGENVAGATKNFGMVSDEADAVWTLTVKNEGQAKLEGLAAALSGEQAAHYSAEITGATGAGNDEIEAGAQATITVKQLKDNLDAHEATLTISATGLDSKVITLSGSTRDHTLLYVDFDGSNDWPSAVASHGANWEVYAGYARQNSATASSLVLAPLTILDASDALRFKASRYNNDRDLTVRYTTNGGVTWNDYNFGTNETPVTSLKEQITSTSSYNDFEITNIPAGTVAFDFYGKSIKLDNINADYRLATAPLVAFTKVTDNISDANLTADAEATYTLANNGNADYVGTVAKANVNVAISGEGVTYEGSTLTIPAGKTAEITVTMPFAAPYGAKNGSMTITSESWVGDVAVNYTANLIDPDAINVDFASAPAGWYNAGWTVNGTANIYSGVEKELISEQYAAEAGKNVLSFKAKAQSGSEGTLKVYTSTDRKAWSEPTEFTLTGEYATKSLAALADGNYYVKFVSLNANIDDLTGLKKITTAPEHDLYVSTSNIPTETKVPETSITATATVYSLRAAETGVYAKMFFDNVEVATADAQNISLNGSKTFELTGNVPATEKTYAAKIVVYYSNNSVAFETLTTDVEVQHTRTLAITAFERVGEGDLSANVDNKITAQFNVTVQNNSTCDLTADEVKVSIVNAAGEVYQMNDADNVTAATAVLAKDESVVIPVTLTISAGEGGDFKFRAKELVSNTATLEANDITIHVNAQAPQFALNIKGGAALADGDDVAFGLVKEATTKQYTISNTGTKALVLTSIAAPAGYSVTEINNVNKTIAVNGTLDIDVTLLAEQGKKAGALVFTYDVNGTPTTFTLALTGRSEAADVWEEYFTTEIPASWQKTGWTWNDDRQTAYSGGIQGEFTLMTPRLSAAAGQVLTYETKWQYDGENMIVQYSIDKTSWTDYETITASTETVEHQFVAPAAGNYYLKFTANRYVNLDNFIGFALNIPKHDMELTASDVPATGKRLNNYVATVTLKENAGKYEDITAELWVNGAKANATEDVTSVEANSNATVVTLTWEPQTTMDAVDAYVKVTYAGGTLQTIPVSLTIAEVYTLSESSSVAVEAVTNETVMLQRTFAAGWNTICLPFAVADNTAIEALFGTGTKVFNFKNYANSMIDFEAVTSMAAATPYLIYVPAAITEPIRVNNVTISSLNTTAGTVWHNSITFHGSYAPVAAGGLTGKYGVTTTNQLAKGNANTTMKGFRAYFEGNLANARIFIFDEATGISRVYQAADLFGDDDRVYNMKGQQVENAKKGVYIVNGKKVVIK